MLRNANLKSKLLTLCAVLASTASIVGGISYYVTGAISANYRYIAEITLRNQEALGHMDGAFKEIRIALRTIGLEGVSHADRMKAAADAAKWIAAYEEADGLYRQITFSDGEKEKYDPVAAAWQDFKATGGRVLQLNLVGSAEARETLKGIFLKDCPEAAAKFSTAMGALIAFQEKNAEARVTEATSTAERGNFAIALFSICALAFGLVVGFLFSNRLAQALRRLAGGLSNGAFEVNAAAEQIAEAGSALSTSSTEQATSLQETVASLDEVSAMVSKNAENARQSKDASESGHEAALRGKRAMDEMRQSIHDISSSNDAIKRQVELSNQEIGDIVKVIAEIGGKTKVINDIVFQTKLLSFNASVEAARAGEHGKGFAVVAEEVGNLAQMSGRAAQEISQLLEESIRKVELTVQQTKERVEGLMVVGQGRIQAGMAIAGQCGTALDDIVRSVSELGQMVAEIATASSEQADGVREINTAMGSLDQVAQHTVATSQQAVDATTQLNEQAAALREIVDELVYMVDGSAARKARPVTDSVVGGAVSAMKRHDPRVVPFPKRVA